MSIVKSFFDKTADNKSVFAYTMSNCLVMSVKILDFGGIVNKLLLPDRDGDMADCVCGFDTIEGYLTGGGYQGAIIGRYCNRIADAKFELNRHTYRLAVNEKGKHHLHGGNEGFNLKFWDVTPVSDENSDSLILNYTSPDGEEGYPGRLVVTVTYKLTSTGVFSVRYQALSDRDTVCNLTNHSYFNLAGYHTGNVLDHELTLLADYITEVDSDCIPTGKLIPVGGTAFDFRHPKAIRQDIGLSDSQLKHGCGYDHNYVLNLDKKAAGSELVKAAVLYEASTGRKMELWTNTVGIQLYTANMMNGDVPFKGGMKQTPRGAVCLETQYWPDTPNNPDFPSCTLHAGERYDFTTEYRFSTIDN